MSKLMERLDIGFCYYRMMRKYNWLELWMDFDFIKVTFMTVWLLILNFFVLNEQHLNYSVNENDLNLNLLVITRSSSSVSTILLIFVIKLKIKLKNDIVEHISLCCTLYPINMILLSNLCISFFLYYSFLYYYPYILYKMIIS